MRITIRVITRRPSVTCSARSTCATLNHLGEAHHAMESCGVPELGRQSVTPAAGAGTPRQGPQHLGHPLTPRVTGQQPADQGQHQYRQPDDPASAGSPRRASCAAGTAAAVALTAARSTAITAPPPPGRRPQLRSQPPRGPELANRIPPLPRYPAPTPAVRPHSSDRNSSP